MFNLLSFCSAGHGLFIYVYMAFLLCEYIFQNIELNAAHHLRFSVKTLWSPKTMLLIKSPKIWVSMRAITFCWCVLWKVCITWHFWARNRKLTFSWKITPQGAIPPLKGLLRLSMFHQFIQCLCYNSRYCQLHPQKQCSGKFELKCKIFKKMYSKISNINRTKSQNLILSRLVLQMSLCNLLKSGVS